jgi:hypothetical protein
MGFSGNTFPEWAIVRAEKIAKIEGLRLVTTAGFADRDLTESGLVQLTLAIVEALVDARNFETSHHNWYRERSQ